MKISETMNSKSYFFDTYAIIELIKGNSKYEFLKESIIITSSMNLAEVYYALLLENKKEVVDSIMNKLDFHFLEITSEIAKNAAVFRYQNKKSKMSYIDCVGYTLAVNNNLPFLTGDKEFEGMENVEFIKKE